MIIKIRVRPNSKKQDIEKIGESEYKVSLKEKAEDNKANIELLKFLRKQFGKEAKIIKGLKSKNKIVKIEN